MTKAIAIALFIAALLIPGGLIGFAVARYLYRRTLLTKGEAELRKKLGA